MYSGAYPATTGPDHGRISEIAGYVNYHANRVYNGYIISIAVSFPVKLSIIDANNRRILAFFRLRTVEILASLGVPTI